MGMWQTPDLNMISFEASEVGYILDLLVLGIECLFGDLKGSIQGVCSSPCGFWI